jgi:alpha-beta hydrolase superfamily lysophospholipase
MEPIKETWKSSSGKKLFAWHIEPNVEAKGIVLIVHGHGEHSLRYLPWAERFAYNGFVVQTWDHIGHGQSEGRRGHVKYFEQLLFEIDLAITKIREKFPKLPIILYGHSMGGNIVLNYAVNRPAKIDLLIATSPWLHLTNPPSPFMEAVSSFMNVVFPIIQIKSTVKPEQISRIPEEVEKYANDPLNHGLITPRLYTSIRKSTKYILKNGSKIKIPTLLMHGNADTITSHKTTSELSRKIPNATYVEWEGCYHELHHEDVRDKVFSSILDWINEKL